MARSDIGNRPDKWRDTLIVNGRDCGMWSKRGGGAKDSGEAKYSPGGMTDEISLGGRVTNENVTVQRAYDHELFKFLDGCVGSGAAKQISQPLDSDGIAYGEAAIAWEGVLKKLSAPDSDASSDGEPGLMEIEVSVARRSVS